MSLLIFCYILAVFFFVFSYYLDSRSEKSNSLFTGMSMASAFTSLFAGLSASLVYSGFTTISALSFKVCLVCFAFIALSLFKYACVVPYFKHNPFLSGLATVFVVASVFLVFSTVQSLEWTVEGKYLINTVPFYGLMDGLKLYVAVYLIGIPALSVLVLLFRAMGIRSRIYRQRLLLVALSICIGFTVSFLLYKLSHQYSWALPLITFGLAVTLVLIYQSVGITTLFDRTLIISTLINFTALSLVISVVGAFVSVTISDLIPYSLTANIVIAACVVVILFLRDKIAHWLRRYVRSGSDYAADLEAGLDSIDYTSGNEVVIQKTVSLLQEFVECSTVEIMVSDNKGKLLTVFSENNTKHELSTENKSIDFLLSHNESIVLKTQAIANHAYADIKNDLLKIFDVNHADAFILLREGHRVVGIILLGSKKRGADYTDYDYTVLQKLYSNFFLVMYYLKNIANEAVVLTVDREIEFSGQIITSIQENIDRISHDKIDADFITRSARKLGGDFIDFIKLGQDKYLYVMGDVSGKGLNASMSMVILKSVLRTFLTETSDFKKLVIKVNFFIKNNLPKGTFFAGVFGLLDFNTNTMYYINCGVPAMFLYTASYNNAIEIQGDGKILGFVKDVGKYLKVKKIMLNPQDIILMTTDGFVDSTNLRGERFGKDRVQHLLMDNRSYPAGRMAKFLCDNLEEFVSRELEDDITVLVLKYVNR